MYLLPLRLSSLYQQHHAYIVANLPHASVSPCEAEIRMLFAGA